MSKCGRTCQIFSRVTGYHAPITNWNKGKVEEFKDRKTYNIKETGNEREAKLVDDLHRGDAGGGGDGVDGVRVETAKHDYQGDVCGGRENPC